MRIIMVSDVFFPRVNGVSTSIQTFADAFVDEGHEVTLIAPQYPEDYQAKFDIIRIPSMRLPFDPEDRLMNWRHIRRLLPELRQRDYDIIHVHTPFVAHYVGTYLAEQLNIAVITSYHTYFEAYFEKYLPWVPSEWLRGIARRYSRRQCNSVDGVVSPSQQMLDKLREYGTTSDIRIIPTGLVLEDFDVHDGSGFREKYGLGHREKVLLYVGRVAHEKNIDFLINAFAQLAQSQSDVKLVIAGEGPALKHLQNMVKQLGLASRVLFLGYLERETELIACYRASDIFVFASETETQGLVLLEAMACSMPVVSIASMGTQDVLKDGQGCLIAEMDIDNFCNKLELLLNDSDYAEQISKAGSEYVRSWSSDVKATDMLRFYDAVHQKKLSS